MKISCREGDEGYEEFLKMGGFSARILIYLNGIRLEEAVAFDAISGEAWVLARDEWGEPIVSDDGSFWHLEHRRGLLHAMAHAVYGRTVPCSRQQLHRIH